MKDNSFDLFSQNRLRPSHAQETFGELEAAELYCPKCGSAVPVNKFLLLILPEGDKYEYRCRFCGTSVGKKTDKSGQFHDVLKGRKP